MIPVLPYAPPQEQPSVPQSRAASRAGVGKQRDRWCLEGRMNHSDIYYQRFKTDEQRFWENVHKTDGCWTWIGARTGLPGNQYGAFYANSKQIRAHRFSWELSNKRSIPDGMFVCHSCDNGLCVRPSHLWIGTNSDNMKDGYSKGRVRFKNSRVGEGNGRAVLTDQNVREIRQKSKLGSTCADLSSEYGVCPNNIRAVIKGTTWKNVIQEPAK